MVVFRNLILTSTSLFTQVTHAAYLQANEIYELPDSQEYRYCYFEAGDVTGKPYFQILPPLVIGCSDNENPTSATSSYREFINTNAWLDREANPQIIIEQDDPAAHIQMTLSEAPTISYMGGENTIYTASLQNGEIETSPIA
jgi:hypothetical protein